MWNALLLLTSVALQNLADMPRLVKLLPVLLPADLALKPVELLSDGMLPIAQGSVLEFQPIVSANALAMLVLLELHWY